MTATDQVIAYEKRSKDKKSTLSGIRKRGMVPAVIYGDKKEAILVSIDHREIFKNLRQGKFFSTIYALKDQENDNKGIRVLPRDVQMHPVKDTPVHVDFLRVTEQTVLRVSVPVTFINEENSPGLKAGGILTVVRHEVELVGKLGAIPSSIEVDLSNFELGVAIKISAVSLPESVEPTITNRDFMIANIALPKVKEASQADEEQSESEDSEAEE